MADISSSSSGVLEGLIPSVNLINLNEKYLFTFCTYYSLKRFR